MSQNLLIAIGQHMVRLIDDDQVKVIRRPSRAAVDHGLHTGDHHWRSHAGHVACLLHLSHKPGCLADLVDGLRKQLFAVCKHQRATGLNGRRQMGE